MTITATNDNERVALEFFTRMASGNLEAVRDILDPEATWTLQAPSLPGPRVHRGHQGILDDFLGTVGTLFLPGEPKLTVLSIASKEHLILLEAKGSGLLIDGRPFEQVYAWAIEVRRGRIYALREYMDSHYLAKLFGFT